MARFTASRSTPHVVTVISAAIARLTNGSIHSRPVSTMATAASTTPAEMAASPAMCTKVARMFRSSWPRTNSAAVSPLTTMPAPATQMTVAPATGEGDSRRSAASNAMAPTPISSTTALASAAMMVLRPQP